MKLFLTLGLLTACVLDLTACASPPVHYYTLMTPTLEANITAKTPPTFLVDVLPVSIPSGIDRQTLVVRQGENGLLILDGERWTTSFGDEFRDALSDNVTRSLGTHDVAGLTRPKGSRVVRVKLQVRRLDAWLGQRVQLEANWMLSFADDAKRSQLTCHAQFDIMAPGSYPQLVSAQQQAIALLAADIATNARRFANSPNTDCDAAQVSE